MRWYGERNLSLKPWNRLFKSPVPKSERREHMRGPGSLPEGQRAGICTASYQGVGTSGRTLTFGSGTRLQVHPSKCLTLDSSQRHRNSLLCFPRWWICTSWANFSCFFMRLECFKILISSHWLNSGLFSNARNCPRGLAFSSFLRQTLLLFLGPFETKDLYQTRNYDWLCQKYIFLLSSSFNERWETKLLKNAGHWTQNSISNQEP